MKKTYVLSALIAAIVSLGVITGYQYFQNNQAKTIKVEHIPSTMTQGVAYGVDANGEIAPLDFTETSARVIKGVVHITATQSNSRRDDPTAQNQIPDAFREFFGDRFFGPENQNPRGGMRPRVGTGSGVIINPEGYIVTNNHVISGAEDVEVNLHDNRSYKATVIGTDPTTDLALIKIKADDLESIPFVNSDDVKIGEWVLAVGNPFSLNSTVTAGIVSAKGRNININRERFAVESFIQTDAAINPGNSGGALVNLQGGLVGINTAIASPTGSYSGYGFAVPSNIVNKIVEDLLEFGKLQRGVLGIMIRSVNGNLARQQDLDRNYGVYVDSLLNNSAAGAAGVLPGDVIVKVDDLEVRSSPELQELIARKRPGDEVLLTVDRRGKERQFTATLNNTGGGRSYVAAESKNLENLLGADLQSITKERANELDISGGVEIEKLHAGKLRRETNMREGFIVTHANGERVESVEDLESILAERRGGVMLEGIYPGEEGKHYFAFGMDS